MTLDFYITQIAQFISWLNLSANIFWFVYFPN